MRHNGERTKINVRRKDPGQGTERQKDGKMYGVYEPFLKHREKVSHIYNFNPSRAGKRMGAEMIFEEGMAENFSIVKKWIKSQIQEAL